MSFPASPVPPVQEPLASDAQAIVRESQSPLTRRVVLMSVGLAVLSILWVLQTSLIGQSVLLGGSVPPVPAMAVLLLLAAVNPFLGRFRLRRSEILLIAMFVGVAVAVADPNCLLAYFFAFLMTARYAPTAQSNFTALTGTIPDWFAPRDQNVLKGFAEGHAPVAWGAWAVPLLGWGLFFAAMWAVSYAVLALFRDRWIAHERLSFPIVELMVDLTPAEGGTRSYLTNRLLWAGVGCSAVFNLLNIFSAFYPGIPAPGRYIDVGVLFTTNPWKALSPLWISLRPEIFGIGYLMNTEVLFTAWFSYLALRLSSVIGVAMGYDIQSGYYDYQEIAAGAYLGVLGTLLWTGRGPITGLVRQMKHALAFYPPGDPRALSSRRNRFLAGVVVVGFAYQLWWVSSAGLVTWAGGLYLALLLGFAVVYSRIRAETGAPIWFVFPFWQQQKLLLNVFGTAAMNTGSGASLAALAMLGFLSRGTFPQLAAFHIESMDMAERARIRPRHMAAWTLAALPFGLLVGLSLFLMHSYHFGFFSLDGGAGEGGFRVTMASQQYRELAQWRGHPTGTNLPLVLHTLIGAGLVTAFGSLRSAFLGFPLHPLGFAMAASYGIHLWAPFLVVWAIKLLILRAGGAKLHRACIPFFLGIVVGHYLMVGVVWGGLAVFMPQLTQKFTIHFS